MTASVHSFTLLGVEAHSVVVEADLHTGLPAFSIVGLPDTAVRESRERVRAAIRNAGFDFPAGRITVNLAPADVHKTGPNLDLAIATALLVESCQLQVESLSNTAVFGELALDGDIRAVCGALNFASKAQKLGLNRLILPAGNTAEASVIDAVQVLGVTHLREIADALLGRSVVSLPGDGEKAAKVGEPVGDIKDVRGHENVKLALEVAAAGAHNLLMRSPPGCGKTMLAQRLSGILPPLALEESIEVTKIYSVAGLGAGGPLIEAPPFRSPHHSISTVGLIGGGSPIRPGEISLAHRGVLFLDEISEFAGSAIESLRQPLEQGSVTITRSTGSALLPARITLVAATNPCPCGFLGDPQRLCTCSESALSRYRTRLSGPLLDRIDLAVDLERPTLVELSSTKEGERSSVVRKRVVLAREIQAERSSPTQCGWNAQMGIADVKRFCHLDQAARRLLAMAERRVALGGRGYVRVLRVARTVADLAGRTDIGSEHLAIALSYRGVESDAASPATDSRDASVLSRPYTA